MSRWGRVLIVVALVAMVWFVPSAGDGNLDEARIVDTAMPNSSDASVLADASPTTGAPTTSTSVLVEPDVGVDDRSMADADANTVSPVGEQTLADTPTTSSTTSTSTTIPLVEAPAPTNAPETTTSAVPAGSASLSLGEQALQRVSYPWRSEFPDWEIVFRGPRNGIRALTFPEEKRVEIFIRSSDTAASLHRVFAHELGHVIDVEMNSTSDRDRWVAQRGIDESAPWWPSAESPDFATGAGDFAEAFAVWETGVTTRSTVSSQPTAADLALLRELSEG